MSLDELLKIAYNATHGGFGNGTMYMSANVSSTVYTQAFTKKVIPVNNKTPKKSKNGSTILTAPYGYKELNIWVKFGNHAPTLSWLYMDRSLRWDGEQVEGNIDSIDELQNIVNMLEQEEIRIANAEFEYRMQHDTLDGLVVDGYAEVE